MKRPLAIAANDSIKVFVKINDGGSQQLTVPIDLPKDWNVGRVKEYLVSCFMPDIHRN